MDFTMMFMQSWGLSENGTCQAGWPISAFDGNILAGVGIKLDFGRSHFISCQGPAAAGLFTGKSHRSLAGSTIGPLRGPFFLSCIRRVGEGNKNCRCFAPS